MAKEKWTKELLEVLWAYKCTPLSTRLETPYNLIYGIDAMIPIEIGEPSLRKQLFDLNMNNESLTMNLDWLTNSKTNLI